jgi:hypothetical protein
LGQDPRNAVAMLAVSSFDDPGAGGAGRSLRYLVRRGRSGDSGLPFLEHLS